MLSAFSFLKLIVDHMPLAVFCKDYKDEKGVFLLWNHQAERLWNLQAKDVLTKTDAELFPKAEADFFRLKDLETLKGGEIVFIPEEEANSQDPGQTWVRTWKIPVNDENGVPRYLLGVSQDISELKRLELDLKNQTERAALSSYLLKQSDLIQQVAHQLNNPFAIVLGRCKQLLDLMDKHECPPNARELLDSVRENVEVSVKAVDQLLHLSSVDHKEEKVLQVVKGENTQVKERTDTENLIHDLANILAIAVGKTNQLARILEKPLNADQAKEAKAKISSISETLKRMTVKLEAESKRGRA